MYKLHKRIAIFLLISIFIIGFSQLAVYAKKPVDTQPPTAPQNLIATSIGQTSISLKWTSSTDKNGVAAYIIYRDSINIATTSSTTYTISNLTASKGYSFYIKAKDTSGNISSSSNVLTVTTSSPPAPSPSTASKLVVGYYAGWSAYSGYTPLDIQASGLTHINYAFAKIGDDLKIALGDPYIDPSNFTKLNELKRSYPQIKTLISIGGWNDSGKFSDAASTDANRTVFADSLVAFIKQYGFNGVDIDWEYPVGGGLSSNSKRPEDKTNFTLLLKKIREKLDAQGSVDNQKYLLTIAGGAGSTYAQNTELNIIGNYLDYAIIMTYDIHGTWDSYTDLNAPLFAPTETSPQYKWSVEQSVNTWTSKGFPAGKIVLGVPFYGYIYNGVSSSGNGLYSSYSSGTSITYDNILRTYLTNDSYIKYIHTDAKVPWLFNGSTFISYDDEISISEKAKYIVQNDLAGASIWELSQNAGGQLLNALLTNLK